MILFVGALLIPFLGKNVLNWFVELTSFGALVGYGYTSASAWKLEKAENIRKIIFTSTVGAFLTASFVVVHLVPQLTIIEAMGSALPAALFVVFAGFRFLLAYRHSQHAY